VGTGRVHECEVTRYGLKRLGFAGSHRRRPATQDLNRRDPLWQYLGEIKRDQGAVLQLTPEGIALFDAAVVDRRGIDYGCVVAGVPEPREKFLANELLDPEYVAPCTLFRLLHALTALPHPHYPYPKPESSTRRQLDGGLGFAVTQATNDGIVPTFSQVHGRLVQVARADHLDVAGHYTLAGGRTADWLPSGASFTPDEFGAIWEAVATTIAANRRPAL
jgi:hypothetical protein